ncbi:MAG: hypothetical protein AUK47_16795 [Deltaproteobacteria bacterium CG2_30_63_29]|nr:MAG: hypothetical protein AUK47_16795 [Deltaproteobacteria bacterium CG2_30_63_29]
MAADHEKLFLGLDVGSVSSNLVAIDADKHVLLALYRRNMGDPAKALAALLRECAEAMPGARFARGVVAGSGKEMISNALGIDAENEIVAHAYAAGTLHPEARSVIEIGGQDSKFLELGHTPSGEPIVADHVFNDLCAAGTGAFLDQQAERLQLSIEAFSKAAGEARRPATLAGRCSVFAKTDMIHLQQAGRPTEEIVAGLCFAMARNYLGVMLQGKTPKTPLLFQGGVAANAGMVRAFRELLGLDEETLIVPEHHKVMGALGSALLARHRGAAKTVLDPLEAAGKVEHLQGLQRPEGRPHRKLSTPACATNHASQTHAGQSHGTHTPASMRLNVTLGIDVGSVSTKGILLTDDNQVLAESYLPTRGNPLEAVKDVLAELEKRAGGPVQVRAVAATGSGRHLVGNVIGADVVRNEITAQARGALFFDAEVDTIIEIGGQDAKFIRLEGGRLKEFEMNKVCAAGTGAFLEEQGRRLGLDVKAEFADVAFAADTPAPLGTRCTVFMDTDVVNHLQRGTAPRDIVAGLAYSIAENYLEKVSRGRAIGERVLFQGGVAANGAVVAAFESLLDRSIAVPPLNHVTGALGVALLARECMDASLPSRFRGFQVDLEELDVRTFECHRCSNLCEINKVTVPGQPAEFLGSICGRFDREDLQRTTSTELPDLLAERETLLLSFVDEGRPLAAGRRIGIPRSMLAHELLPMWATTLQELGYSLLLSPPSDKHIVREGVERMVVETCLPMKAAFGHLHWLAEREVDRILMPALHERVNPQEERGDAGLDLAQASATICPYIQSLPFMAEKGLFIELLTPPIQAGRDLAELAPMAIALATALGGESVEACLAALRVGSEAQHRFHVTLQERGRQVLDWLDAHDDVVGVVLLGRDYHVHDRYLSMDIAQRLRKLDLLALPMDFLPLPDLELGARPGGWLWDVGQRMARAARFVAFDGELAAISLSSFGCGPDAFTVPHLDDILENSHFMTLEFDEQRAGAGLTTRLEAFAEGIRSSAPRILPKVKSNIDLANTRRPLKVPVQAYTVYLHHFADHVHAIAGALRKCGVTAHVLPRPDEETVRLGKMNTGGGECHAFVCFAGDLVKLVKEGVDDPAKTVFHILSYMGPCLAPQYGPMLQRLAGKLGVPKLQVGDVLGPWFMNELGIDYVIALGQGMQGIDRLLRVYSEMRVVAKDPGRVDDLYRDALLDIEDALANGYVAEALQRALKRLTSVQRTNRPIRARIGIVGDIYTRINDFANDDLPERLRQLGCAVWMPSTLTDVVVYDFWRENQLLLEQGRLFGFVKSWSKAQFFTYVKNKIDQIFDGVQTTPMEEDGQKSWARVEPYLDPAIDKVLTLNLSRTLQLLDEGADGVINVICHGCILGKISHAMFDDIRQEHDNKPILTLSYDGLASTSRQSRLEAFVHQAASHGGPRPEA